MGDKKETIEIELAKKKEKIDYIYHIGDIHIRMLKRHEEYNYVFNKLYKYLREEKKNNKKVNKKGIIYIAGDILHVSKDLSPECIKVTTDFLKELSKIMPLIAIPGNHDDNGKQRMNGLEPMFNVLEGSEAYLLDKRGTYHYGNITFGVTSVLEGNKIFKPDEVKNRREHVIGLYHGIINGVIAESGIELKEKVNIKDFVGYNLTLLGDIHKFQYVNKSKTIAYSGSLICQKYNEELRNHGVIKWDLETYTGEIHEIKNKYSPMTLVVKDGEYDETIKIPKCADIRMLIENTSIKRAKEIEEELLEENGRKIYITEKNDKLQKARDEIGEINTTKASIVDEIKKYFKNHKEDFNKETRKAILKFHEKTMKKVTVKEEITENSEFKIEYIYFSNMMAYGEKNFVDFRNNTKKIMGIIADNQMGKSSIIKTLIFGLFGKFIDSNSIGDIINHDKNTCFTVVKLKINSEDYYIIRGLERIKNKNPLKEIILIHVDKDGKETVMGKNKEEVKKKIKKYVGNVEDFVKIYASTQDNTDSFLKLTGEKKKKLITGSIGLDIYPVMEKEVNKKSSEVNAQKKIYNNIVNHSDLKKNKKEKKKLKKEINKMEIKINEFEGRIEELKNEITDNRNKIDGKIIKYEKNEVTELKNNKKSIKEEILDKKNNLDKIKKEIKKIDKKISIKVPKMDNYEEIKENILIIEKYMKSEKELRKLNNNSEKEKEEEYCDMKKQETKNIKIQKKIDKNDNKKYNLQKEIKSMEEKINKLDEHEYDPECKYCTNNEFVKDAIKAKDNIDRKKGKFNKIKKRLKKYNKKFIEVDKSKFLKLENEINENVFNKKRIEKELNENKKILEKIVDTNNKNKMKKKYEKIIKQKNNIEKYKKYGAKKTESETKKLVLKNKINNLENNLRDIKIKLKIYKKSKKYAKIYNNIEKNEEKNKELESEKNELIEEINNKKQMRGILKEKIVQQKNKVEEQDKIVRKMDIIKKYKLMIGKSGIPLEIFNKFMPIVEQGMNEILQLIECDFTVKITNEDKNPEIWIKKKNKKKKLCKSICGFEKSVIDICFRVSMSNILNVPKANIMIFDETLKSFDQENKQNLKNLMDYLKSKFDNIILVSHESDIKQGAMDLSLNIEKKDGFSKVKKGKIPKIAKKMTKKYLSANLLRKL